MNPFPTWILNLRESMRFEIKELQASSTYHYFVTHDQSEAMAISDRMMVCDMGDHAD